MGVLGKLKSGIQALGTKIKDIGVLGKKILMSGANAKLPIPQGDIIYAELSKDVYNSPSSRNDFNGFEYDDELGDAEEGVWVSSGKAIIAYRGSASKRDWLVSDVKIIGGTEASDSRVTKSIKFYDEVSAKYPNKTIVTTGHSLGGRLANIVAQQKGGKTVSFSTGCGMGCINDYKKCQESNAPSWCHNKKSHRVLGAPLSAMDLYGGVSRYLKGTLNPHSMNNYV